MRNVFARLSNSLVSGINIFSNLFLIAMLCAIGTQVVARFVLGAPTVWAEELARYLLVSITMLGSASLLERNKHISIDILVNNLPPKAKAFMGWLRDAITITICGLLVNYGWLLSKIGGRQTSTGLEIKMSVPYMAIPIGAGLMALVLIFSRAGKVEEEI